MTNVSTAPNAAVTLVDYTTHMFPEIVKTGILVDKNKIMPVRRDGDFCGLIVTHTETPLTNARTVNLDASGLVPLAA